MEYERVAPTVTSKGTRTKGYSYYYINIKLNNGKDIRIYDNRLGKNPYIKKTIIDYCNYVKDNGTAEIDISKIEKIWDH